MYLQGFVHQKDFLRYLQKSLFLFLPQLESSVLLLSSPPLLFSFYPHPDSKAGISGLSASAPFYQNIFPAFPALFSFFLLLQLFLFLPELLLPL